MTKILHGWMKVLRRKLCPKSMHVNLLMLIRRTTMSTWNSRLYQQNYQKWYCKEEDYYCVLSDKLNDPHTSGKSYWSILKTLYNGIKIPLIPPILINSKLISNFKQKESFQCLLYILVYTSLKQQHFTPCNNSCYKC